MVITELNIKLFFFLVYGKSAKFLTESTLYLMQVVICRERVCLVYYLRTTHNVGSWGFPQMVSVSSL